MIVKLFYEVNERAVETSAEAKLVDFLIGTVTESYFYRL